MFGLSTFVYWLPLIALFVTAGLYLFGVDIDALGAVDDLDSRWKRRVFPRPDLRGITAGLFIACWSATGLSLNAAAGKEAAWYVHLIILAAALTVSYGVSYGGTLLFDLLFPSGEDAPSRSELVGQPATILDAPVSGDLGRALLQLPSGGSITIFCKNIGEGDFPPEGSIVMIAAYDEETNTFDVF